MLDEKQIHLMFYENGKTKDRKDPSKRVTKKVMWSETFTPQMVQEVFSTYKANKEIRKIDGLPFIANMAYNGLTFTKSLACYAKVSNKVLSLQKENLIDRTKEEIFAMIGYLLSLKRQIASKEFDEETSINVFLCEPIFKFESYKKVLKLIGIKVDDSKIITRARNTKRIIRNTLGYDSSKISLERLQKELEYQINFFINISDAMCFDTDEENFSLYILRYDLKKCKS